jgi:hypothetical protein
MQLRFVIITGLFAISMIIAVKTSRTINTTSAPSQIATPSLNPVCNSDSAPKFTPLRFQECLVEGMTITQAANVLGFEGELTSTSGSTAIYNWRGLDNKNISIVFTDGKLVSKAQTGLE